MCYKMDSMHMLYSVFLQRKCTSTQFFEYRYSRMRKRLCKKYSKLFSLSNLQLCTYENTSSSILRCNVWTTRLSFLEEIISCPFCARGVILTVFGQKVRMLFRRCCCIKLAGLLRIYCFNTYKKRKVKVFYTP